MTVDYKDLATEVILTLGQAFEVAYQLVLREDMAASLSPLHISSQKKKKPVGTPAVVKPSEPVRKIGPKPTVLPPKPKLGTALLNKRPPGASVGISHARSHSSVDRVLSSSTGGGGMTETRLQSESNLASLQAASNGGIPTSSSVTSMSSSRAPLAAKDEL